MSEMSDRERREREFERFRPDPLSPHECARVRALLEVSESDADFFGETRRRMHEDAPFNAAVHYLAAVGLKHGFTPYELKQIAFAAALQVEMYSRRSFPVRSP